MGLSSKLINYVTSIFVLYLLNSPSLILDPKAWPQMEHNSPHWSRPGLCGGSAWEAAWLLHKLLKIGWETSNWWTKTTASCWSCLAVLAPHNSWPFLSPESFMVLLRYNWDFIWRLLEFKPVLNPIRMIFLWWEVMADAWALRWNESTLIFPKKNAKLVGVMLDIEQRYPNLIWIP